MSYLKNTTSIKKCCKFSLKSRKLNFIKNAKRKFHLMLSFRVYLLLWFYEPVPNPLQNVNIIHVSDNLKQQKNPKYYCCMILKFYNVSNPCFLLKVSKI